MRRSAAALLGLALLLGACSSSDGDETLVPTSITRPRADAPITTVPGAPPLAVVLGDSNTFLSGRELNKAVAAKGLTPDVRGISGSGVRDDLRDWFPAAEAIGRGRPSVVVVALGTNDAVVPEDAQAFAERAELLLQALGDVPVVWVTHTASGSTRDPANEQLINDTIRGLPALAPERHGPRPRAAHRAGADRAVARRGPLLRARTQVVRGAHRRGGVGTRRGMSVRSRTAALVLAGLGLAACSSSTTATQPDRPPSSTTAASTLAPTTAPTSAAVPETAPLVAMLGDSNTYLSIPELESAFGDAGLRSTIRGISGSGLKDLARDWLPAARAIAAAPPAVVVIALGTNDALLDENVGAFAERLDALLDAIGDVPVVWVTHTEHAVQGREPEDERAVNDVIRAAPTRHPNVTVLDLAPEIDTNRALVDTDALHFSEVGQQWFAEQITEVVASLIVS